MGALVTAEEKAKAKDRARRSYLKILAETPRDMLRAKWRVQAAARYAKKIGPKRSCEFCSKPMNSGCKGTLHSSCRPKRKFGPLKNEIAKRADKAAAMRRWRQTPVGRASIKITMAKWHAEHTGYERERSKRRYVSDPVYRARVRKSALEWWVKNPGKRNEASRRYWHRRRAGGVLPSEAEIEQLKARFGHRCAYCCKRVRLTLDHIVPVSKNGTNDLSNLLPACRSCNSKKKDRPLEVFLAALGASRWVR